MRNQSLLDRASHPISDGEFWWINSSPKKVVSFIWRAKQGRIPSADELQKRNIQVASSMCGICRNTVETTNHVLTSCPFASDTINRVLNWCGVPTKQFSEVTKVIDFARSWGHCPKKKEMLTCILYGTLWSLWKERNDRVFRGVTSRPATTLDSIKSMVFSWRKYRMSKGDGVDWDKWCMTPISCI